MYVPKTTYRIQFTSSFTFKDLENQLLYLEKLGVDTIYASPIFKAQPGSTHGYDVTDFSQLNPELGSEKNFESLMEKLRQINMGWVQDIVPNHMAYSLDNPYITDVLQHGRESRHAKLFDIFWDHHDPELTGKLMVPVLGADIAEVVENDELHLQYKNSAFVINYYDNNYPLSDDSVEYLAAIGKKAGVVEDVGEINAETGRKICNYINHHHELLFEVIDRQHYLLCHWKTTEKKINYRRFFTVNDLICVRQEDESVFQETHGLIKEYCSKGYFQGLRVDHVDGLLQPGTYLNRLRKLVGEEIYILVEKILGKEERLPAGWPVQGSTGYDYLGAVNELLIRKEKEDEFTRIYVDFTNENIDYVTMLKRKKRFILRQRMAGELENLLHLLEGSSVKKDPQLNYKEAVSILLSHFPVYRTYIENETQGGWHTMSETIALGNDKYSSEFEELRKVFSLQKTGDLPFVLRFQQLSGPLAAKGGEDTAFYQYNRFISQNEVGDEPSEFGMSVPAFHEYIKERQKAWQLAMNGSSTHDTKRGEDTRARLAAISVDPRKWEDLVQEIEQQNPNAAPVSNDRYMILQSLVGAWPFNDAPDRDFAERFQEFLMKALREGKNQTSWSSPNIKYENACFAYSKKLQQQPRNKQLLSEYVRSINAQAITNSLNTVILRFTLPGIPDVYQGCESWNFSFVDPDNRRPVDYERFNEILNNAHKQEDSENIASFVEDLWQKKTDEELKIFITHKLIQLRRSEPDLLVRGDYLPLSTDERSIAFLRKHGSRWLLVHVPLEENSTFQVKDLPAEMPQKWENVFTKEIVKINENRGKFPFVCLRSVTDRKNKN